MCTRFQTWMGQFGGCGRVLYIVQVCSLMPIPYKLTNGLRNSWIYDPHPLTPTGGRARPQVVSPSYPGEDHPQPHPQSEHRGVRRRHARGGQRASKHVTIYPHIHQYEPHIFPIQPSLPLCRYPSFWNPI